MLNGAQFLPFFFYFSFFAFHFSHSHTDAFTEGSMQNISLENIDFPDRYSFQTNFAVAHPTSCVSIGMLRHCCLSPFRVERNLIRTRTPSPNFINLNMKNVNICFKTLIEMWLKSTYFGRGCRRLHRFAVIAAIVESKKNNGECQFVHRHWCRSSVRLVFETSGTMRISTPEPKIK